MARRSLCCSSCLQRVNAAHINQAKLLNDYNRTLFSRRPRNMKIGVLTGGGDCAGLNATIRGLVARAEEYGFEVIGIERGWKGLIEPKGTKISYEMVEELVGVGGTFILTSRTNPFKMEGGPEKVVQSI